MNPQISKTLLGSWSNVLQEKSNHTNFFVSILLWIVAIGFSENLYGQYQINGNASQTSCNCYILTQASNTQVGSVWNTNKIDLTNSFDYSFEVYLGCSDGGADGIVFGLQPIGTNIGTNGNGMGLGGVSPSLGVYIDTYQNGSPDNDPAPDHISIQANGNVVHNGGADDLAGPQNLPNVEDCQWHGLRVVWDAPSLTMTVYFDGTQHLTYTGDIVTNIFGSNPDVYWGFTGATGGLNNLQQFCTKLRAQFTLPSSVACPNQEIQFTDVSESFTNISTFSWNFGDGNTSTAANPTHTYTSAGTYTVTLTITDDSGCSDTFTFDVVVAEPQVAASATPDEICVGEKSQLNAVVTPPPLPTCSFTLKLIDSYGDGWNGASMDVKESGATIGNYTLNAGASDGTFAFSITHGNTIDLVFNGGSYDSECSYELYDANGNLIASSNALTAGATVYSGVADCGYVAPVYSYAWTPSASLNNAAIQNPEAEPIETTEYTVTISDVDGCTAEDKVTVTIKTITVTESSVVETCIGDEDGTITLTGSNGVGPYTYTLDGQTNSTGQFTGFGAGDYSYTVTDDNGCQKTGTITLAAGPNCCPMTHDVQFTNPNCNGACDGTITITQDQGADPVQYSIDGGTTFQSSATFSDLCVGAYSIVTKDANDCELTATVNLVDPPALVVNLASKDPGLCFGDCLGDFSVSVNNGTPPYQYNMGNGPQSSGDFVNVCANTYSVVVTDDNGCEGTLEVEMTEPTELQAIVNGTTDAACGVCNGTAQVMAQGGTVTYQFDIGNGAQSSGSFSDLCPGVYTVVVSDANNCSVSLPFTIEDQSGLSASITDIEHESCNGFCDGRVEVNGAGGGGGYSYSIGGGAFQSSGVFSGLCAGTHTVTCKDQNGCEFPVSVTIEAPDVLTLNLMNNTPVLCHGDCNGAITVSANGGDGSYSYDMGNGGQTSGLFSDLCAQSYTITVRDGNDCVAQLTEVITQPDPLSVTATTQQNASASDVCDGQVTCIVLGGTTPYNFDWGGAGSSPNDQTTGDLCGGSFCVTITDDNGCIAQDCTPVTQPAGVTATETHVQIDCFGNCSGSIDLTPNGGDGNYTFVWSGPSGFSSTSEDISGLCDGTYQVTITDGEGETAVVTVLIVEPPQLLVQVALDDSVCYGLCKGSIALDIQGGTPNYGIAWSADNGFSSTDEDINNLCPGVYSGSISDANGCLVTVQHRIYEMDEILTQTGQFPAHCNLSDGAAFVNVSGGEAPYFLQWMYNTQDMGTLDSVVEAKAGRYDLTVTDSEGCQVSDFVDVPNDPGVEMFTVVTSDYSGMPISCNGVCDAELEGVISGGIPPYSFDLGQGAQSSNTVSNLCAGTYEFIVTDGYGCKDTNGVFIDEPDPIVVQPVITHETCENLCDAAIVLEAEGGIASYQYSFSGCSGFTPANTISGLCAGDWTVCVQDVNGCQVSEIAQVLPGEAYADATILSEDSLCANGNRIQLHARQEGGVWSGPGIVNANTGMFDPTLVSPGDHLIEYAIHSTCPDADQQNIHVRNIPHVDFSADTLQGCQPLEVMFLNHSDAGTAHWNFGNQEYATVLDSVLINYNLPGLKTIRLQIQDEHGCVNVFEKPEYIEVFENPIAAYSTLNASVDFSELRVHFVNHSERATHFSWFANGEYFSSEFEPEYVFPDTGTYDSKLIAISEDGCTDSIHIPITIKGKFNLYIPNSFTPDADNLNEVFIPVFNDENPMKYTFSVFDRWGEQLFYTENIHVGWNGRIKGELVQQDVYVWKIKIRDSLEGIPQEWTGVVNVIR